MEKQIIFRDYQEQQAQDHLDLQDYTRQSIDHVVLDAVTDERKFAGFLTQKTAQTEIQVAPGRFYDVLGAIYQRSTTLVQSMNTYLPAVAQKYCALTVSGTETETDVEERDFLVDVDTGRTEPDAVATVSSRDAVLAIVQGTESSDPQYPSIPIGSVVIAYILLDTTQIVSVTMVTANRVVSTNDLDTRTDDLETFEDQIGPRVSALASDLAALEAKMKRISAINITQVYQDLGRIKDILQLPDPGTDYGADSFMWPTESDYDNALQLGYAADVERGLRFPDFAAAEIPISLFSANDPNAKVVSGLLLPAYTEEVKLQTGAYHSALGIAQYGFATYDSVEGWISKSRLRYGGRWVNCANGLHEWDRPGEPAPIGLIDFTTWASYTPVRMFEIWPNYWVEVYDSWWHDSWKEPYWYVESTDHSISGAQVAQSFLVANDMWLTKLGFYLTVKAAEEAIHLILCEIVNGVPDISKTIAFVTLAAADIVVGWNRVSIVPAFAARGKRYAVVLTSSANHQIGMSEGTTYLDGTFFYNTDGVYFLGDLTKDMMLEIWGCKFNSAQVTIEFAGLSLGGGMLSLDITAGTIIPSSCQLVYEVRPNGAGDWIPLAADSLDALADNPILCQFRARFVGTLNAQPGIRLTDSRVKFSRPATTFKHISTMQTLAAPSSEIHVKLQLENFQETPHDVTCKIWYGSPLVSVSPSVTTTKLVDPILVRYERDFKFDTPSPQVQEFCIEINGTTNSASNIFLIAERLHYAL